MKKIILIIILIILFGLSVYSNKNIEQIDIPELSTTNMHTSDTIKASRKVEWIIGYNLGWCYRGKDLLGSGGAMFDFITNYYNNFTYLLNNIEGGIRFPYKNNLIEVGMGYGWANIGTRSFGIAFPDILINDIIVNSAYLGVENINKFYFYYGYDIAPNLIMGLELNYCRAYGYEYYCLNDYSRLSITIRRDLIGGGIYMKIVNTKMKHKVLRFDPYLMCKISISEEIRSTSPYSELWDKNLTVWYTGIYTGFNFNIGGK